MAQGVTIAAQAPPANPAPAPDRGAAVFVWGAWALMLGATLAFAGRYGLGVPFGDEWDYVPELTGARPLTAAGLWAPHGEHRMPLAKPLWLTVLWLTDYNFRVGVLLNDLALGALALGLILTAQRARGWMSYSDAFFPLVLLHWGHGVNLLWWWQINELLAPLLIGLLLLIIVRWGARLTLRPAVAAGVCLVLLSLAGPGGLPHVLALALWLGSWGVLQWRSAEPRGRRNGLVIGVLAAAAVLLVGLYFVGYERPPSHLVPGQPASHPGWKASVRTSLEFLSTSFSPAAKPYWQYSAVGVLGLLLASLAALGVVWWKQPRERFRALGLLLLLGAVLALALALGWGRARFGYGAGLSDHYTILMAPALCCVYFIWGGIGAAPVGRFVQMGLFVLACLFFALNTQHGLDTARSLRAQTEAFERDLQAGKPCSRLAQDHFRALYPSWLGPGEDPFDFEGRIAAFLRMLHRAGLGPFRQMREDPPLAEAPFPVEPVAVHQVVWDGAQHTGRALGNEPRLVFALGEPRTVGAIRVKFTVRPEKGTPSDLFRLYWKRSDQAEFTKGQSRAERVGELSAGEKTVTAWVFDTIDQFRIDPGTRPCSFRIAAVVLLVPAPSGIGAP
jgi:hypothetical protein